MVCSVWGWGGDRERRPEKPGAASTRTRTTAGARRVRRMPEAEGGALASEGGGDGSRVSGDLAYAAAFLRRWAPWGDAVG